ncbi:unnamed protein product [Aphanomyces euteiches]
MNHDMMPARVESAGSKAYGASWCAILHSSSGRPVAVVLSHPNDGAPFCVTLKKDCPTTISMQFEQVPVSSPSVESLTATQNDSKATVDEAQRKLEWACLFCVVFMVVELLGGYFAGSLAIMSDAAHLLSDVLSFFLSLFALYLSKRPATASMPFGYKRAEAIGALASIIVIWMLTIGLVWAAVQRILALTKSPSPHTIPQVNGRSDLVSESCAAENLNVRAAYLHALGDFLQSLGVCLAGALIW